MLDLGVRTRWLYLALRLIAVIGRHDGSTYTRLGTGFVVRRTSGELALVTARHVVDPRWTRRVGEELLALRVEGFCQAEDDAPAVPYEALNDHPVVFVSANDAADVAWLTLNGFRTTDASNIVVQPHIDESLIAAEKDFGVDIAAGDFFVAPGYVSLPDTELVRPIFMMGVIAADPRHPAVITSTKSGDPGAREVVLYQALSRGGLSGAPVLATQRGIKLGGGLTGPAHRELRLAGVNGGHYDQGGVPLGYSYFIRSSEILRAFTDAVPAA